MKTLNTITRTVLGICLVLFCTAYTHAPDQAAGDFVVIVNASNPVTSLTASQVKLTYLRKINKRWKELNKNILPVDRKAENDTRKSFLKEVLQMTPDELSRYYTEREYQNAEAPPVKLASDSEVISYVENNVGAIGYVNKAAASSNPKVKIVYGL